MFWYCLPARTPAQIPHPDKTCTPDWLMIQRQIRQTNLVSQTSLSAVQNYPNKTQQGNKANRLCCMTTDTAKHYRRPSGLGLGLACGISWLPKWHSQPGLSLARRQSHASSDIFCRTAWGSSSALFCCLLLPGRGSNGQSPPESLLTHQESMYLSKTQMSNKVLEHHQAE